MPELRIDPLSGARVIVADERGDRPGAWDGIEPRPAVEREGDPFAEGNEGRTPAEVYAVRPDGGEVDGPGWKVRVVPNLYPALSGEGQGSVAAGPVADFAAREARRLAGRSKSAPPAEAAPGAHGGGSGGGGDPLEAGRGEVDLFAAREAVGGHEVIVNSPRSVDSLLDLSVEELGLAMGVWRERMRVHGEAACRHLIVNEGRSAGASLPHTHAQLYALPFVPAVVARERERFTAYHERTQGRNLLEDLTVEEVKRGERLVAVDGEAVAFCPFASAVPFQMQVVPRRAVARFEDDGPLAAGLLHEALRRLAATLGALPPLNLWVRTAPSGAEAFCWRIDVQPRLAQPAGLELGTGVNLNALAPERAAERLRAVEAHAG